MRDTLGEHIFDHFLPPNADGVGRLHASRVALGDRALSEHLLTRPLQVTSAEFIQRFPA